MTTTKSKTVAVLTSGGDAPGMNAAIRAIVRTAKHYGMKVLGITGGYHGLLTGHFIELNNRSVSNIIQRGGTILKSARCMEFKTEAGRKTAITQLNEQDVDALLVIGGDGSLRGAHWLSQAWEGQIIGLPGTIDNDLSGTDWTIGYFTALDTALDAIDKIRDTADAIDRVFIVEVMGRMAGFIALGVGIGAGAEDILVPEQAFDMDDVDNNINIARERGKISYIIVVAEGAYDGGGTELAKILEQKTKLECRPCILGHIQRGGSPSVMDRILATKLGAFAVQQLAENETGVMVGIIEHKFVKTPLEQTWLKRKSLDSYLLQIHDMLSE